MYRREEHPKKLQPLRQGAASWAGMGIRECQGRAEEEGLEGAGVQGCRRVLNTSGTKLFAVCLLFSNAGCVIHFRS